MHLDKRTFASTGRPNTKRKRVKQTKRRVEITIENHRLIVLSRRNRGTYFWCDTCEAQVRMVTADAAAQISGVSTRTIYRRIENGRLHFIETEQGFSLICLQSLGSNAPSAPPEETEARAMDNAKDLFRKNLMKRILKGRTS
jgi:hypothetical protein